MANIYLLHLREIPRFRCVILHGFQVVSRVARLAVDVREHLQGTWIPATNAKTDRILRYGERMITKQPLATAKKGSTDSTLQTEMDEHRSVFNSSGYRTWQLWRLQYGVHQESDLSFKLNSSTSTTVE